MSARAIAVAAALAAACSSVSYVGQAAFGQLDLINDARPIDEVIRDPRTDDRTRVLLSEVGTIKQFARGQGMTVGSKYRRFVEVSGPGVVWVVTASKPLAFEPKTWSFPFAGEVPYLGWFDQKNAMRLRDELTAEGWDVLLRTAGAYSTLGWFDDPILSSMWSDDEYAFGDLANILLHELTHATVYVPDQSNFNESVASFVGDHMAEDYLIQRFGEASWPVQLYRADLADRKLRDDRSYAAYKELEALYASDAPDADKLQRKAAILESLRADLKLSVTPNNGGLLSYRMYRAGIDELAAVHASCGGSWPRFFALLDTLTAKDFDDPLQEDLAPVMKRLLARGCGGEAS